MEEDAVPRNALITEKQPATSSSEDPPDEWKADRQVWLIMITLVVISLMAALDATILVTALPVSDNATQNVYVL